MDYKSTNGPMKCVFVSRLLHAISYLQTTLYQLSLAHLDHVELLILHLFRAPNVMYRKRLHRNRFQQIGAREAFTVGHGRDMLGLQLDLVRAEYPTEERRVFKDSFSHLCSLV